MAEKPPNKDPYDTTATQRSARRATRIKDAGGGSVLVRFKTAEAFEGLDLLVSAGIGNSRPEAILNLVAEKAAELKLQKKPENT
jgi:hypothetical protein